MKRFIAQLLHIGRKAEHVPMAVPEALAPDLVKLGGTTQTADEILTGLNGVIDEMLPNASPALVTEARLEILWSMAVANGKRSGNRPGSRFTELCNKEGFKSDVI